MWSSASATRWWSNLQRCGPPVSYRSNTDLTKKPRANECPITRCIATNMHHATFVWVVWLLDSISSCAHTQPWSPSPDKGHSSVPLRTQVPPTSPTHFWVNVCLFLGYQNQIHAYTSSIERYFLFALYMSYLVQEYEDTSWHVRVCILLALIPYRSIHCS